MLKKGHRGLVVAASTGVDQRGVAPKGRGVRGQHGVQAKCQVKDFTAITWAHLGSKVNGVLVVQIAEP